MRLLLGFTVPVLAAVAVGPVLELLRDDEASRLVVILVALVFGVAGVFALFWSMNALVDLLPGRVRERARPWVFVGPALAVLALFLIYPVVNTVLLSLRDARGEELVGADNYEFVFSDEGMRRALRNTAGWIVIVPAVGVAVGLVFAALADRLGRRSEAIAKSMVFLPMAISFVGAAVVWRFVYSYRPEGFGDNIGLLNGVMQGFGRDPVPWLQQEPWNNLLLMVIMIWMQTGFAMVVLSAAIKAVPEEIIEAARIDGASELQVFRRIVAPTIRPTLAVVITYMIISGLKVFDIVFVMGNASTNGTEVVAERMIRWFFLSDHDGRGAAIAVVLFVAVIPVMVWNIRRFREQEAVR